MGEPVQVTGLDEPLALLATSCTFHEPVASEKVGFWLVEFVPSGEPALAYQSQAQLVGEPEDASVQETERFAVPLVGEHVHAAVGGGLAEVNS